MWSRIRHRQRIAKPTKLPVRALHFVLIYFVYFSSTVVLSFIYYIIRFVGISAVTLLVCLINVLDLHVVSIAKLYVIKNLNLNPTKTDQPGLPPSLISLRFLHEESLGP